MRKPTLYSLSTVPLDDKLISMIRAKARMAGSMMRDGHIVEDFRMHRATTNERHHADKRAF